MDSDKKLGMKAGSGNVLFELFRFLFNFVVILISLFISISLFRALSVSASALILSLSIMASLFTFLIVFFLLSVIILKFIFLFIKSGRYKHDDARLSFWFLATNIQQIQHSNVVNILLENSLFFKYLYLKLLGAKVSFWTIWGAKVFIDGAQFIKIGKNSIIGDFSVILTHTADSNGVYINYVSIGDNCVLGEGSTIFPGVKIGNNSVIGSHSLVLEDSVIGENEVWAGTPAKKIKDLE